MVIGIAPETTSCCAHATTLDEVAARQRHLPAGQAHTLTSHAASPNATYRARAPDHRRSPKENVQHFVRHLMWLRSKLRMPATRRPPAATCFARPGSLVPARVTQRIAVYFRMLQINWSFKPSRRPLLLVRSPPTWPARPASRALHRPARIFAYFQHHPISSSPLPTTQTHAVAALPPFPLVPLRRVVRHHQQDATPHDTRLEQVHS
jgi:hypothetical protein